MEVHGDKIEKTEPGNIQKTVVDIDNPAVFQGSDKHPGRAAPEGLGKHLFRQAEGLFTFFPLTDITQVAAVVKTSKPLSNKSY